MRARRSKSRLVAAVTTLFLATGAGFAWLGGYFSPVDPLVVYCAHDAEFAEQVIRDFERQTGIPVSVRYDTEATKSLGLVNLLIQEQSHPRCDLFWNNQVLTTMELKNRGLLLPYKGPGFTRIPDRFKDADGHWTGFAARLRVYIVNIGKMKADEESLRLALADDLSRGAIAKPLYGTTLSHYALLWHVWGADKLRAWHADTRRRGLRETTGNAAVKNLVAEGACDFGFTDSDDFFVARDEDKPVAMLPIRFDDGATICIPNSIAIIKGTRRLAAAQKLADFLLSQETEHALAVSPSRQIPLGPTDHNALPAEVRELTEWARDGYDLRALGPAHAECLQWLKSEYLR